MTINDLINAGIKFEGGIYIRLVDSDGEWMDNIDFSYGIFEKEEQKILLNRKIRSIGSGFEDTVIEVESK